jgi:hypothetical protein
VIRTFPYRCVGVAGTADDDQVGEAEVDQFAEPFGAVFRGADDAEAVQEVLGQGLGLGRVLHAVMVVVVLAGYLFYDPGILTRQRRRYVALKVGRDARVTPYELVEGPPVRPRADDHERADVEGVGVQTCHLLPRFPRGRDRPPIWHRRL